MTSRSKLHSNNSGGGPTGQVCADCSSPEPGWASLNRGVLICSECCSIHRTLGRHITVIRRFNKPAQGIKMQQQFWGAQRALISALFENGANNIWEHLLLDPVSASKLRRKPNPRDPLHPTKAEFIRAKYSKLSFCLRTKDHLSDNIFDLNKQLAACVRTCHVETTLRLLALGASPNFVDVDKGCLSPMHVAAKEGQALQIELLVLYGGDVSQPDAQGRCALDYAKEEGHKDLIERIMQIMFQCTDRLSFFLCDRLPDHQSGSHFLIPEMACAGTDAHDNKKLTARSVISRKKLAALTPDAFEHAVQDVGDEVDRRETDNTWTIALKASDPPLATHKYLIPFLPVTSDLSATRNQSRQKLAKLNARDLAGIIIDLLIDAKRRAKASCIDTTPTSDTANCMSSGGDPHSPLPPKSPAVSEDIPEYDSVASRSFPSSPMVDNYGQLVKSKSRNVSESGRDGPPTMVAYEEYCELREQVLYAETRVDDVLSGQKQIFEQLQSMSSTVDRLTQENAELRINMSKANRNSIWSRRGGSADFDVNNPWVAVNGTSDNPKEPFGNGLDWKDGEMYSSVPPSTNRNGAGCSRNDNGNGPDPKLNNYPQNLIHETEILTAEIQKLLYDAQSNRCFSFVSHANRIRVVVDRMVTMIPRSSLKLESISGRMVDACISLTVHCSREANSKQQQEQISYHIVQSAFEVAKSAKLIMEDIQR